MGFDRRPALRLVGVASGALVCALCAERVHSVLEAGGMKELSQESIGVLLDSKTSRPNKLALGADYRSRGVFLRWEWLGRRMRSRLAFRFSPTGRLFVASSYEEDVAPLLEERAGGKP